MATQNPTYNGAPAQLPDDVLSACVSFLARKDIKVTLPKDPVSIAQAMLVYMGVGTQHPINGINHAMRVIDTFYCSRVNPSAKPVTPPVNEKKQRKKEKAAKRKAVALAREKSKAPRPDQKSSHKKRNPFYQSADWKRVRYEALKRSQGRCECCGRSPNEGAILNVDHIKPLRRFPHLSLSLDNLQVLCGPCNQGKGGWDRTDWREPQHYEKNELDREYERIMQG